MANQEQSEGIETEELSAAKSEPPTSATAQEPVPESAAEESELEKLKKTLQSVQSKADDNWNKFLRAQAEMDNLRKRSQRELENARKFAIERFATELLPVKDSLELGLGHSQEQAEAKKLHEGMELTLKMLIQVMEKFNIEEIDPQGQPFDPEYHQAMSTQENAELAPNTVIAVMQKGYKLNERLLRPAMVIVSTTPNST